MFDFPPRILCILACVCVFRSFVVLHEFVCKRVLGYVFSFVYWFVFVLVDCRLFVYVCSVVVVVPLIGFVSFFVCVVCSSCVFVLFYCSSCCFLFIVSFCLERFDVVCCLLASWIVFGLLLFIVVFLFDVAFSPRFRSSCSQVCAGLVSVFFNI